MSSNEQNKAAFKQRVEAYLASNSGINSILDFLPNSEYELILYMIENGVWQGGVPQPPADFKPREGAIEVGLFLYWFNHPDQLELQGFSPWERFIIEVVLNYVAKSGYLPATKLTFPNYSFFKTNELIYKDGTVLSTEKYANFDQGWFTAFLNLFISLIDNLWYNGGTFPPITATPIPITGAVGNTVSIAVLGDWGAANNASNAVMQRITSMNPKPDYIVHVGDVYYGGTPSKDNPHAYGDRYLMPGEEQSILVDLWPPSYSDKSFTLNSNHEMYSGANGLFYDAYGVSNNFNTPFSAQKGQSCFALTFGGWTILGLDSAYHSPITTAFMTGSIGESNGEQSNWIKSLNLDPKKTIVMTHHNGFADDCSSVSPLWDEIRQALGGDPYAWYWGHVHNGIVYDRPITIPAVPGKSPSLNTNTFARCLGHAALPYGMASSLAGKPIAWKADSPMPFPSKQLYNGFAVITLTTDGANQLNGITESFYDVSPKAQPVYTKKLL